MVKGGRNSCALLICESSVLFYSVIVIIIYKFIAPSVDTGRFWGFFFVYINSLMSLLFPLCNCNVGFISLPVIFFYLFVPFVVLLYASVHMTFLLQKREGRASSCLLRVLRYNGA